MTTSWLKTRAALAAVATGALALAPAVANADEPWHLRLEAVTDVPVDVGARATVEGPLRLRASTGLGWLPRPYVQLINGVVVASGGYDDATAELVEEALNSSLVWRTHVGWRPFAGAGFYVEGGYGLVTLGGGLSAEELLVALTGAQSPGLIDGSRREYEVRSTLHMLDAELGWEFLAGDRLSIRAALGGAFTVDATTRIEVNPRPRGLGGLATDALAGAGEAYLDDVYTSYVFSPTVTVGVGWRAF